MTSQSPSTSKALSVALWVLQALLALAFLGAGLFKVTTPGEQLAAQGMNMPVWALKLAGASEVLGAVGLILPAALRIQPRLTPIAAALLAVVMVLAVIWHLALGEAAAIGAPIVFGALCAFVAWGRFTKAPIASK